MNPNLENLLEEIIDKHEALSLDNFDDKLTLIKALSKELTPMEYSDVVRISEAIFPNAQVDETFDECEVIVNTGLYNAAAGGDRPHLISQLRAASSREIFPVSDTEYIIMEDKND